MDYIRNSKNRKLKTQILNFFSRMHFGQKKLDISGRSILFLNIGLLFSLFFPWLRLRFLDNTEISYTAFSGYTGWLGYGVIISVIVMIFFLLSHEKKERIRAYVPFRLSDAQAVVFVASLLLVSYIHFILISLHYTQIAVNGVELSRGFIFSLTCISLIIVASFFYSQDEKFATVSLNYLDKKEIDEFGEYSDLIQGTTHNRNPKKSEKNMTLPI